ncbi:MAG TPA: outer membrane lipoprotein-sorting protein [Rectinemataceae bacterium]|nr:outer membrane lipoprotein-sorting protein [Rectinemataceae bacterium]
MRHDRSRARLAAALAAFVLAAAAAAAAEGPDPAQAMKAADEAMYPRNFSMTVSILTRRPGQGDSRLVLEVAHRADMGTFMEMLSPPRSRGTRFLQTEGALWMYSPRSLSRLTIRLSPRESFQGSVFSNNDVSETTWSNDYAASLAGSTTVDCPDFGATDSWIVSGKALRPDVPYGEIRLYLRKGDLLPLKVEYFAKSGLLLKTMLLSDYGQEAGRLRPRRMLMTAADGTGEQSVVTVSKLRERNDLPAAMFNQAWLVR